MCGRAAQRGADNTLERVLEQDGEGLGGMQSEFLEEEGSTLVALVAWVLCRSVQRSVMTCGVSS